MEGGARGRNRDERRGGTGRLHPGQHRAAGAAARPRDQAPPRPRVAADLAEDRGGARRGQPAPALLGVRVARRPGARPLRPGPPRARVRPSRARPRVRLRARRHRRGEGRCWSRRGQRHRRGRADGDAPQRRGQRGRVPGHGRGPARRCSVRVRRGARRRSLLRARARRARAGLHRGGSDGRRARPHRRPASQLLSPGAPSPRRRATTCRSRSTWRTRW